jgi:4-hydroxyphenylpyruvate dioxygenase-like putative hemolysin
MCFSIKCEEKERIYLQNFSETALESVFLNIVSLTKM